MVVQGAVNPDEFYVHKPTRRQAVRPSYAAPWGRKIRMVYAATREHGKQVKIEDVPQEQRDIFSLTNEEVQELAKQAVQIEQHYGRPMDIEWAKDGHTGKLFIVQARPETVRSRGGDGALYATCAGENHCRRSCYWASYRRRYGKSYSRYRRNEPY